MLTVSEPLTVLPAFVVLPEVIVNVSANAVDAVSAVISVSDDSFNMRAKPFFLLYSTEYLFDYNIVLT